jgi:N-dimethylarginine dimethylaminohydrolase
MNMHATLAQRPQPRFLMCRPQHFAVTYSINPWMDPTAWAETGTVLQATAARQWNGLQRMLTAKGAQVEVIEAVPGLPDLVFTANAAIVLDRRALLARFRHPERQGEQPVFAAAFAALQARGLIDEVVETPETIALEGAGDCIWDQQRQLFWMGSGFRSDVTAKPIVEDYFGVPCVPLALAEANFYHLDTAFCALSCGAVIYYPAAFTPEALDAIHQRVTPAQRIALTSADAARFSANSVCFGEVLVLSSCSESLRRQVEERGYRVAKAPLHAFLRSGGSACCLTLRLDHRSQIAQAALPARRVAGQGAR